MSESVPQIVTFLITSIAAGVAGIAALEITMWVVSFAFPRGGNMIDAVGSLMTRSLENARLVGIFAHVTAGLGFALLYTLAMVASGMNSLPSSLTVGIGIGSLHGLLMSLILVWVVSDNHPIERFRKASLGVGVSHMAGHVAFGAAVGLVVGLAPA